MRKFLAIITCLFTSVFIQAQRVDVHIDLGNNSSNVFVSSTTMQQYGTETTDAGLNTIFQNHGVYSCYMGSQHPITNNSILFACYSGSNINAFISDLRNYTLAQKVAICGRTETFGDVLYVTLINESIGTPTGTDSNGIITTNNNGLNTLFQTHNVKTYRIISFPGSTSGLLQRTYYAMCDGCNIVQLKNDLQAYNTVIESGIYAPEYVGVVFLSNNNFEKNNTTVFPNPFQDKLTITSEEKIKHLTLYDVLGKENYVTTTTSEIEKKAALLECGIYFLKIEFENGEVLTYKIIKK